VEAKRQNERGQRRPRAYTYLDGVDGVGHGATFTLELPTAPLA
jgi:hypothetical protein